MPEMDPAPVPPGSAVRSSLRERVAAQLLGPRRGPWILFAASALVLLAMPGAASLWTMEGRSAVICREMMRSGDYFHPYLFDDEYFDKPLPPYWMMIGSARILGTLSETALRLPGILAGLLAVFCTWRIGARRFGPAAGLTAGWLLLTSCCFVFWSRVAGADILNLAAVVAAVAWYMERRDRPGFLTSSVFFALLAAGAQMKGLIAPVLAVIAILPDLFRGDRWLRHLQLSLVPALLPAALLYLAPFAVADTSAGPGYESRGLLMVFRENVLRYFQPFDHRAPIYVYLKFLPLYLLPWTPFLVPVLWRARHWRSLGADSWWPLLASLFIFLFLTLSGSRRNYYILPVLPFVVIGIAEWISEPEGPAWRRTAAFWTAAASWIGMLVFFGVASPILWQGAGKREMAAEVRRIAEREAPWGEWKVVLFNTGPQMGYYLDSSHRLAKEEEVRQALRDHPRTIVVTYFKTMDQVQAVVGSSSVVRERSILPGSRGDPLKTALSQVAFIPRKESEGAVTPRR